MTAHPLNRPHAADAPTSDFLFKLYELLFEAKVELRIKQTTFETAANSKNSWRVVSVSKAALEHIDDKKTARGLQRGHILARSSRAKHLFERDAQLTKADLLTYFFEHDTVALVTKNENAKEGVKHWSTLYPVPNGIFDAGSFSIYVRKGKEIPWVETKLQSIKQ